MTDKERYQAAMAENHELRVQLENWKAAHKELVKENHELKKLLKDHH